MMMLHSHEQEDIVVKLTKSMWFIILFLIPSIYGMVSLFLGKDFNWDLRNYHYYNAYAFLEHRLGVDIAPAQLQTFFNPMLDLPFYWMTKHFPSRLIGFVLGFAHGLNLSLILFIFWKITCSGRNWLKFAVGICVIVITSVAPGFISELGTTFNDNIVSLFFLSALLILIAASEAIAGGKPGMGAIQVGVAGLVMGIGVGLKPIVGIYAMSSGFALIILLRSWRNGAMYFICYVIAGIVGGLISAGYWWWELWSRFGNPLFPFLNNLFESPYVAAVSFMDKRFLPLHVWEYFVWPLIFSWDSSRVAELHYSDVRFALYYLICCVWLCRTVFQLFRRGDQMVTKSESRFFRSRPSVFLLLVSFCAFLLWMINFSIYRYLIPLELLVPLCFLVVLERVCQSRKTRIGIAVSAALIVLVMFTAPNHGRIEWGDPYFEVDATPFESTYDAVAVMLGTSPMAYVVPHLPPNLRVVRPEGNLRLREKDRFFVDIKTLLEQHKGVIYILFYEGDKQVQVEDSLVRLGLNVHVENCFALRTNTPDRLKVCRLITVSPEAGQG